MNKQQIIDTLDAFLINEVDCSDLLGELCIVYGAAMVLNGVRTDTNDIDISCTMHAFEEIHKRFNLPIEPYNGDENCKYMHAGSIDFFLQSSSCMKTVPRWRRYQGYSVQSLTSLAHEKILRGREKDIRDVKLIHDYIESHLH